MQQPTQNHADRAVELLRIAARDEFASAIRLTYWIRIARDYGVTNDAILDAITGGDE